MFRFFFGFLIGFLGIFLYIFKNREKSDKISKNKSYFPEDTTKLINVMKEFQKMKERI